MQPSASGHSKDLTERWLRPQLDRLLARFFRTDVGSAVLYLIVGAAIIFGHANQLSLIVGGVVSLLGLVLRIVAAAYGHKAAQFAVQGPYRWLRHPYLLGVLLFYVGIALAARNAYVAAATLISMMLILKQKFVFEEERWARHLGLRWADYQAYVPAFLPRLLPVPADTKKNSFSLALALFGEPRREILTAGRWGLVFVVLYLSTRPTFGDGLSGDLFKTAIVITTVGYPIVRLVYHGALPYARTALYPRSRLSRSTKSAQ